MRVAIIGATGFIGQALIQQLLRDTDYRLVGFSKSASQLDFGDAAHGRLTLVSGDLFDGAKLERALHGCDVAVYLVHMMGSSHDYATMEAKGAEAFAAAANQAGVQRVVFMGGLGNPQTERLSKHLASRQRTGAILREQLPLVIELRASMIIGHGSVGYEIIKAIAHKLPYIVAVPRWAVTLTQPIALTDALRYLAAALTVPLKQHTIVEIGGPDVLTYPQILSHYTAWCGHREHVFIVRGVPLWVAKWWLNQFVSSKASAIGGPMVESLHNTMVVTNDVAKQLFPEIKPVKIETAFV